MDSSGPRGLGEPERGWMGARTLTHGGCDTFVLKQENAGVLPNRLID